MIIVVGSTYLRGDGPEAVPDGLAGRIATAAAAADATVELVSKVGDDPSGDQLLLAFARARVGHVAVLRDSVHHTAQRRDVSEAIADPADGEEDAAPGTGWIAGPGGSPGLEPNDVGLALRYLTDYRVVVAVLPDPGVLDEVLAGADWASADLVVVTGPEDRLPDDLPASAVVLEVEDPFGDVEAVASRLGAYAAAVDRGDGRVAAFEALTAVPASG
jgi:hypothetical protein